MKLFAMLVIFQLSIIQCVLIEMASGNFVGWGFLGGFILGSVGAYLVGTEEF